MRIDRIEDTAPSPLPAAAGVEPPAGAGTGNGPVESRDLVPLPMAGALTKKALEVTGKVTGEAAGNTVAEIKAGKRPNDPSDGLPDVPVVLVRNVSPREMSDIAMDLYISGVLSWDEYSMLAFQPELHPNYDATVGALTGEAASPDQPRDFVALWEERLGFERRHNSGDKPLIHKTERIVQVLRQIENPTDILI